MASGGIYDHLGGGFARYATDRRWLVPHFEKMLYDQAGLLRAYLHGWQLHGLPAWRQVCEEVVAYVERDLAQPEGGISSAEDADSEGEESGRSTSCWRWVERSPSAGTARRQRATGRAPTSCGVPSGATSGGLSRSKRRGSGSSTAGRDGCAPGSTTRC
jgi:hypothetical protein